MIDEISDTIQNTGDLTQILEENSEKIADASK
jgi:hypothetical protein